ncbi:MAG: MBL fold metallo-hydrolase [Candidatus Hydrogenedentes bacterium]|nr:MBL fold metallo-hydrolase [Candidatus Hydrogenedentota bacterium]
MEKIAEDIFLLKGFPRYAINIYLIGDVLLDAGTRLARGRILRQIAGRTVTAHALTHAHPDHQGASHAVCEALGSPLWCGENDADAMETGDYSKTIPYNWNTSAQYQFWTGPPHPVARRLKEGDEVAGFQIVDAPGHSPGQVAYWRERDGLLILGDVLNGMNLITTQTGLHEPPTLFTVDPAMNRNSARKLAALNPKLVCFGHGPPWRDPDGLQRFVSGLRHD